MESTATDVNLVADYTTNKEGDTDLTLRFDYTGITTIAPAASNAATDEVRFEAVIYQYNGLNKRCDFSKPIVKTAGAHLTAKAKIAFNALPPKKDIIIKGINDNLSTNAATPVLTLDTPFENFGDPIYFQDFECSDTIGGSTNGGTCGLLAFCVEMQVLVCDKKIDFVDMEVQVEFNLDETCDTCFDVREVRDAPVEDGVDEDPLEIKCVSCTGDDTVNSVTTETGGATTRTILTVNQDDQIDVCLQIKDKAEFGPDGSVCIASIEDLDFEINGQDYGVVPATGKWFVLACTSTVK